MHKVHTHTHGDPRSAHLGILSEPKSSVKQIQKLMKKDKKYKHL